MKDINFKCNEKIEELTKEILESNKNNLLHENDKYIFEKEKMNLKN